MTKEQTKEFSVQGTETQDITNVSTIKGYLKQDLLIAINCLDAVYRDQDLLESMAHFMHGRLVNHREAKKRSNNPPVE